MCGSEFVIATDMCGYSDFTCRRLCTNYLAFALKGPNYLNAEVNVHRCVRLGGMMVEEAIMPAGSQAFMVAEELPDEIKRRLPDAANVSTERTPPHCGERLRADGFGDNLIIHVFFVLKSLLNLAAFGTYCLQEVEDDVLFILRRGCGAGIKLL